MTQRQFLHSVVQRLWSPCRSNCSLTDSLRNLIRKVVPVAGPTSDDTLLTFISDSLLYERSPKHNVLWDDGQCYWPCLAEGPLFSQMSPEDVAYVNRFASFLLEFDGADLWSSTT